MSSLRKIAAMPTGRWTKWLVVVLWAIVVGVAFPLSQKIKHVEKNDTSQWLPASAESTKVLDVQQHFQSPGVSTAIVVYDRASGLTGADRAKAAADVRRFAAIHGVVPGQVVGPIPSADGKAMQTLVPVNLGQAGSSDATKAADALRAITRSGAHGMNSHITGPLGRSADFNNVFSGIDSKLLFATLAVVIVILLITYRSPVLWLLPLISSGAALYAAQGVVYLLAAHAGLTVNGLSVGILYVLVLGASTDYALLIVARYREELRRHDRRRPAMTEALRRAGPAIIASGCTVIIALLMLLFAQVNSTRGLGPVLAIGVAVGMLSMLTLLPALMVIVPRGVFWPYRPSYGSAEPSTRGLWARIGWAVAPKPRLVWITTAVILGILALGLTGLKASGLTDAQSFRGAQPDSVLGEAVLAAHFPAGAGEPVVVVGNPDAVTALRSAFAATPGIIRVTPPAIRADHAYLEGTLTSPPDSHAANATIDQVRAAVHAVRDGDGLVGGATAISMDIGGASRHDRALIIPLVLLVVLLILGLLLRALVAPLILMCTVVLSFVSALGVSAYFFSHVFHFGGEDTSFPLFVFIFLVALGIDYNIFLMTRVREDAHRRDARHGAISGLAATGGVITAAGFVLAGTFTVLAILKSTILAEIGFAVALGILLDTLVVRSVLVTALNLEVGRWTWWPSKLARTPDPALAELSRERAGALATITPVPAEVAGSAARR